MFKTSGFYYLMCALIAGLSCREFSLDSVLEYWESSKNEDAEKSENVILEYLRKNNKRLFLKAGGVITTPIPIISQSFAAADAGWYTYSRGKEAEAYFFNQEIKNPNDLRNDWEKVQGNN